MVTPTPGSTRTRPRSRDLDAVFAALSNPTRRSIVRRLGAGQATISELAEPYDMTLPAVSKHLSVLERAGLVQRRRDGRSRVCSLRVEPLADAESWIDSCREYWTDNLGSLASYLEGRTEAADGETST